MENNITESNNPHVPLVYVYGNISHPLTAERLQAVAKAHPQLKKIKAKKTVTQKVATSFGAVNIEKITDRLIITQNDQKLAKIKTELDNQLQFGTPPSAAALTHGIPSGGMSVTKVSEDKLQKTKDTRDILTSLWTIPGQQLSAEQYNAYQSKKIKQAYAEADSLIEGLPHINTSAIININPNTSGVRIKFQSKNT